MSDNDGILAAASQLAAVVASGMCGLVLVESLEDDGLRTFAGGVGDPDATAPVLFYLLNGRALRHAPMHKARHTIGNLERLLSEGAGTGPMGGMVLTFITGLEDAPPLWRMKEVQAHHQEVLRLAPHVLDAMLDEDSTLARLFMDNVPTGMALHEWRCHMPGREHFVSLAHPDRVWENPESPDWQAASEGVKLYRSLAAKERS